MEKERGIKERKSLLKQVLAIVLADGKIEPSEREFLNDFCVRYGIQASELEEVARYPEKVELVIPVDHETKLADLGELVCAMSVDGEITGGEYGLCKLCATVYGLSERSFEQAMEHYIRKYNLNLNI
ncbi:MAG: hypothetical protein A2Y33_11630 [Spirochaetes bacterium GWF1_51_8]|nr:MAG: hypothetical protein A2Y33_11630 [Spirochaetes bacterium GWF1_51_8]